MKVAVIGVTSLNGEYGALGFEDGSTSLAELYDGTKDGSFLTNDEEGWQANLLGDVEVTTEYQAKKLVQLLADVMGEVGDYDTRKHVNCYAYAVKE